MAIQSAKQLISVDDYHRMAEDGFFAQDERTELIEGEIVEMTPIGNPHALGVLRLTLFFHRRLLDRALINPQNPVRLGPWSEPQPDLALLAWRDDLYASTAPTLQDCRLLVEVSDSSLHYDRRVKMPLYARHGIPESWILNLPEDVLEVYRRPGPDGYAEVRRFHRGDVVAPEAFPDAVFAVSELLGPGAQVGVRES
jgi:Uma2 family endonuclease